MHKTEPNRRACRRTRHSCLSVRLSLFLCVLCGAGQAALGAGGVTTIQFLLRQQAGEHAPSVLVMPAKFVVGLLLTAAASHPLDVMATRAAAGWPLGRSWMWAGAEPSIAYLMLGVPVSMSFFALPVRCSACLCARGSRPPATRRQCTSHS